jgi:hypothetical protein
MQLCSFMTATRNHLLSHMFLFRFLSLLTFLLASFIFFA